MTIRREEFIESLEKVEKKIQSNTVYTVAAAFIGFAAVVLVLGYIL